MQSITYYQIHIKYLLPKKLEHCNIIQERQTEILNKAQKSGRRFQIQQSCPDTLCKQDQLQIGLKNSKKKFQ